MHIYRNAKAVAALTEAVVIIQDPHMAGTVISSSGLSMPLCITDALPVCAVLWLAGHFQARDCHV